MNGFETFLQAASKRKLSVTMLERCAEKLRGKTGEERDKAALELAKEIEETCPLRKEADSFPHD